MAPVIGENINGPSVVRAPSWLANPLGAYYMYFAHHRGDCIRLAYAEDLRGPWKVYEPGTLHLSESHCRAHIASPDVHVDDERREIRMYYHGFTDDGQKTFVAVSQDGLHFSALPHQLGDFYFRVFRWRGGWYALVMPGVICRSADGMTPFEPGPRLFSERMRHSAVLLSGSTLFVFYSNVGDCPERILLSRIELDGDWAGWRESEPEAVLEPELPYEGAELPIEPSRRGPAPGPVRQLRDPAVFVENGRVFLFYAVAGESGIAGAGITGLELK